MTTLETKKKETEQKFVFNRENYIWLISGIVIMAIGFILLIGGGSEDPEVFSYALFDFQRLTLAPILILAGLVIEIFAIMKRPKKA
jgi:formate-dependent nitrite reductase membrane component NrfD